MDTPFEVAVEIFIEIALRRIGQQIAVHRVIVKCMKRSVPRLATVQIIVA